MNLVEGKSEKIVIMGFGWVGQANALALTRMGFEVFYYDVAIPKHYYADKYRELYDKIKPLEGPLQVDGSNTWYIVCIGDRVSEEGLQDISLIEKALESLRPAKGKVILRSTVLPKYLGRLPLHIYLPEFLHELYAVEECLNPFYFVVGIREEFVGPDFLKQWEDRACKIFKGTPEEASHIKYLSNIWNALRVAFVNEFGDSIALPVNEEQRKKTERVIDFFFEKRSYLRYGKTFGGHCLPKDMRAFMAWKGEAGPVPILKATYESNVLHQQVVDTYTLPQWFSSWDYAAYRKGVVSFLQRFWQSLNSFKTVRVVRHFFGPAVRFFERFTPGKFLPELKVSWDKLAKNNPYYYANSDTKSRQNVDEFELRQSGENDYLKYVTQDTLLHEVLGDFRNKVVLEIGMGVGRMTEFFGKDYKAVHGIDISSVMTDIARKRLFSASNVTLVESQGNTIPYPDGQFDMIFSFLVFKHLPDLNLVQDYFREIARTLKADGLVKIQLRTGTEPHPWRWFYGVSLTPEAARSMAEKSGFQVIRSEVENKKSLWLWLKKK